MKVWSVASKDIQILLRDTGTLLMSFALPLIFILAFSLPGLVRASRPERLVLPVVDLDGGPVAAEFVRGLDRAGGVQTQTYTPDQAQSLLQAGDIQWLLEIPADLSQMSLDHPVTVRMIVHPDADEIETQALRLVVNGVARDMALESQLLASFEQLAAMMADAPPEFQVMNAQTYQAQAQSQFERSRITPLVAVEQQVPGTGEPAFELGSSNVTVPGFTVLFVFLTAQVTAQSIMLERQQGSFRRLLAAPVSKGALLVGKMIPNLIMALLQILIVMGTAMVILPLLGLDRLNLGTDPLAVILLSLLVALCSTALGLLLGALSHTETQAGALSAVVLWVMAAVGGSFVPTFLLSGPLRTLSAAVPHSWALRAYNDLFVYGLGLADILPEMGVLAAFTVAFFVIGLWRFDLN